MRQRSNSEWLTALREGAEARSRPWRSFERECSGQSGLTSPNIALPAWPIEDPGPERHLQQQEAWALLTRLIDTALTPRQRTALVAHAFQGMPLDLLAEWLGTNRNSLYKLIHDARQWLKLALLAQGITHKDLIAVFDEAGSRVETH
jgi:RNA polymerase sigma-70 factor, ECF subfamily